MDFMRAGGVSIWIVLAFGLATLVVAGIFLYRPTPRRLGVLRGLSRATSYAVLSGLCANLAAVMIKIPGNPKWAQSPDLPLLVMTGIGETLTVGILGFTLLALAWMMGALGQRRLPEP